MSLRQVLFALGLSLSLGACGQASAPAAPDASPGEATQIAASGAALAPAAAPTQCDSPATPIATGVDIQGEIPATRAPYPANARYYCFNILEGAAQATLRLTGLSADLDLYVGHGAISTVQGVDVSAGETYQWKSNAFGNVDETVTIDQPAPGVYYAEIVSYEGNQSGFVFSVR
jgi:hypothetical protein